MKEPERLVQSGSDFERVLLDSGRFDRPSVGSRKRTLVALGVGSTILGASATATGTGVVAQVSAWAFAKWVIVGALGGLAVVGGAEKMHVLDPAAVVAPVKTVASPQPPPVVVEQHAAVGKPIEPVAPAPTAEPVDDDAPNVDPKENKAPVASAIKPGAKSNEPAAKTSASKPEKAAPMSLSDEVIALDQVQKALASGNASKALELLDQNDGRLKQMGTDATILRMEALAAKGDKSGAAMAANAFLAAHPKSPYATRVRSILANVTGGAP